MPLRPKRPAALAACLLLTGHLGLGVQSAWPAPASERHTLSGPIGLRPSGAQPETRAPGARVTQAAVRQAVNSLRDDPNVKRGEQTWVLTWAHHAPRRSRPRAEWQWFGSLFGSMGEAVRVMLWVLGAVGAGLLTVYLTRLTQLRAARGRLAPLRRPAQVQALDIRPESLPPDVGAAALDLWERGAARAALALLYRGMLSRLVHVHAAPIRASFTEEECADAAATCLAGPQLEYVRALVGVWQRAVYGGTVPPAERFQGLCAALDPQLAAPRAGLAQVLQTPPDAAA